MAASALVAYPRPAIEARTQAVAAQSWENPLGHPDPDASAAAPRLTMSRAAVDMRGRASGDAAPSVIGVGAIADAPRATRGGVSLARESVDASRIPERCRMPPVHRDRACCANVNMTRQRRGVCPTPSGQPRDSRRAAESSATHPVATAWQASQQDAPGVVESREYSSTGVLQRLPGC